jgi:type VI secretion system Hcp family effector
MPSSFLQIVDLPSAGAEDKGWFPIKNVTQSSASEVGKFASGRGREVGYSEHEPLEVKKGLDRSSVFLHMACSSGRLLKAVNLAFNKEDDKEFFLKLELKNVYVSEIALDVSDGDDPEETVKFDFETIVWKVRPKLKSGKFAEWMQGGWNRSDHTEITG